MDETDHTLLPLTPVLADAIREAIAAGAAPPTIFLRPQPEHLMLGPVDLRLPQLVNGLRFAEAQGLPVYRRASGGSAVLLDPQCLCFSVLTPRRDLTSLRENYRQLTAGVFAALASFGLKPAFGEAATYCPGPFDILVDGVKLIGTSQTIRGGVAEVNGVMPIDQDLDRMMAMLEAFYRAAGEPRFFRRSLATTLQRAVGRPVTLRQCAAAIAAAYQAIWPAVAAPPTPEELVLARRLLPLRRLTSRSVSGIGFAGARFHG